VVRRVRTPVKSRSFFIFSLIRFMEGRYGKASDISMGYNPTKGFAEMAGDVSNRFVALPLMDGVGAAASR
jgi:hypothetical protein